MSLATERSERFRSRSKSVATLTAAAAGALSAGLVYSPSEALPPISRVAGLASIILLLAATAVFVIASLIHARSPKPASAQRDVRQTADNAHPARMGWNRLWPLLRPWEAQFSAEEAEEGLAETVFLERSRAVLVRIMVAMDIGLWTAGLAIVFLIFALITAVFVAPTREQVIVDTNGVSFSSCMNLPDSFVGEVLSSDLASDTTRLSVLVDGSLCGGSDHVAVWIQIERSLAAISMASPE